MELYLAYWILIAVRIRSEHAQLVQNASKEFVKRYKETHNVLQIKWQQKRM